MNVAGLAASGPDSPIYDYIAGTLPSLVPMAEAVGVATAAEMEIDARRAIACRGYPAAGVHHAAAEGQAPGEALQLRLSAIKA